MLVTTALATQGHRAWARDHSFYVIYPTGWSQSLAADPNDAATPLLRLSGPTSSEGIRARIVVDHAPALAPEQLDQLVANAGPARCEGSIAPTTVGGANALRTFCKTADSSDVELIYITRDVHYYVVVLSGAESQMQQLRDDLQRLLDSWAWQR